jgi:signal transduction histidine kinase
VDVPEPLQRSWARAVEIRPDIVDAVVGTVFVVCGVASVWSEPTAVRQVEPTDGWTILFMLVATVPYVVRRRYPFPVFLVSSLGVTLLVTFDYFEGVAPAILLFGAYTVGAWCTPRVITVAAVILVACLVFLYVIDSPGFDGGTLVANLGFYTAAFVTGWSMQSRRLRLVALEERAEALERERDEEARRAVADERLRIAQELHDVVAHSMGVIAVQAGVGLHVIDEHPDEAKKALDAIATTSRGTLTEIRRLLGGLREEGGEAAEYAPAPGLDDLAQLVADITEAGVPVEVAYQGERGDVPAGVELAAYRIVQEALTNVLKHAGLATATVTVGFEPEAVTVEVVDDGRGVNGRTENGGGHGLLGMRERVGVYGGTLETGVRPSGGFRVRARLPYDVEPTGDGAGRAALATTTGDCAGRAALATSSADPERGGRRGAPDEVVR